MTLYLKLCYINRFCPYAIRESYIELSQRFGDLPFSLEPSERSFRFGLRVCRASSVAILLRMHSCTRSIGYKWKSCRFQSRPFLLAPVRSLPPLVCFGRNRNRQDFLLSSSDLAAMQQHPELGRPCAGRKRRLHRNPARHFQKPSLKERRRSHCHRASLGQDSGGLAASLYLQFSGSPRHPLLQSREDYRRCRRVIAQER